MPVMVGADVPDGATYFIRAVETPAALPDQGDQNQSDRGGANTTAGPGSGRLCGLDLPFMKVLRTYKWPASATCSCFCPARRSSAVASGWASMMTRRSRGVSSEAEGEKQWGKNRVLSFRPARIR